MTTNYKNFAQSTLSVAIDADDTTLTVADSAKFSAAPFNITIDAEIMLVTAVSNLGVFTVTRAQQTDKGGGAATNHASSSIVASYLTAGDIESFGGGGSGAWDDITDKPTNITRLASDDYIIVGGEGSFVSSGDIQAGHFFGDGSNITHVDYTGLDNLPTLGTAAALDVGTGNDQIVQLNGSGQLPAVSGVNLTNLPQTTVTASKALVSDGSGHVAAATTTSTELGYVSGVTSAIQTQINTKAATSSLGTAAAKNVGSGANLIPISDENGTTGIGGVFSLSGGGDLNSSSGLRFISGDGGAIKSRRKFQIGGTGDTSAGDVLLNVVGASGQSGNYFNVTNFSDTILFKVDVNGTITTVGEIWSTNYNFASNDLRLIHSGTSELMVDDGGGGKANIVFNKATCGQIDITPISNGSVAFTVRGNSSGQDVVQIMSAASTNFFTISTSGVLSGVVADAIATSIAAVQTNLTTLNNSLALVATSGSYANLTGAPTNLSTFSNDAGFITTASVPTAVSQLTNDSAYITAASIPSVPTAVSQLTNDSAYITAASIPSVPTAVSQLTNDSGYQTASDTATLIAADVIARDAAITGAIAAEVTARDAAIAAAITAAFVSGVSGTGTNVTATSGLVTSIS